MQKNSFSLRFQFVDVILSLSRIFIGSKFALLKVQTNDKDKKEPFVNYVVMRMTNFKIMSVYGGRFT